MATPAETKYGFVAGFLNANAAVSNAIYGRINQQNQRAGYTDTFLKQKNDEAFAGFERFLIYDQNANDIIAMLDEYYRNQDARHIYIWSAIVGLCGKTLD
jgi:hypothetical protein